MPLRLHHRIAASAGARLVEDRINFYGEYSDKGYAET